MAFKKGELLKPKCSIGWDEKNPLRKTRKEDKFKMMIDHIIIAIFKNALRYSKRLATCPLLQQHDALAKLE
jgi:hypothetical protein